MSTANSDLVNSVMGAFVGACVGDSAGAMQKETSRHS